MTNPTVRKFTPPLVLLVVLAVVMVAFMLGLVPRALQVPVALVPIVPLAWIVSRIAAQIRRCDEMQVRKQLDAVAFALVALATYAYGLLQLYAGFAKGNLVCMWPVMMPAWFVGWLYARRRYV
jgi:hypothetical protein